MDKNDNAPGPPKTSVEERVTILETDLRAHRNAFGVIVPSVALVFGLLGIALAWNITSERGDLKDFRKEIRDDVRVALGQVGDEPDIVLLTNDGHSLDGAIIEPTLNPSSPTHDGTSFDFSIIISNKGKGWSGNDIAIKLYTPKQIAGPHASTDERGFAFEAYWLGAENTNLNSLPGGFAYAYTVSAYVDDASEVPAGRYDCLVKFYYGHGKIARATFTALIKPKN